MPIDHMKRSDAGETPFLAACRGGYLEIARSLLECEDMDPNAKANNGQSALWCACHKGREQLLQWFLDTLKTGFLDWETAADGLEGFTPKRVVTCADACKAAAHLGCVPIVKEGIRRQRAARRATDGRLAVPPDNSTASTDVNLLKNCYLNS